MPITFYNNWRLEVIEAIHTWPNRFVVSGATSGNGTYEPTVGAVHLIDGPSWVLDAQHRPPGGNWTSSLMQEELVSIQGNVVLHSIVGAEDPLPTEDYRDIRISCTFLGGRMIDIPYRPFAVRTSDLMQMPDGIFEAKLGIYYMGVRVLNRWGKPFTSANVIDITPESRHALSLNGIQVLDEWTSDELDALGQELTPQGMIIGPIIPGQSKTVYFKVDVSNARTQKQTVEFICRNTEGMADPDHPGRKATQHIFISKIEYDVEKNEFLIDAPQGTLYVHIDQVAIDELAMQRSFRKAREKKRAESPRKDQRELQRLLQELLKGEKVDICEIQRILSCYCFDSRNGESTTPSYGVDPYYLILTALKLRIVPKAPYSGQFGEIPFDDPWWKVLLAIIAAILALTGGLEESAQRAYEDEDLIIGRLHDFQQHYLDAALCKINASRELHFSTVLDAQSDEENQAPVNNLNGTISISSDFITRGEIEDLMMESDETGDLALLRVFKSGAKTGTTFAQISKWTTWNRCELYPDPCDDAPDQVTKFNDPNRPTLEFEAIEGEANLIAFKGDSGSVVILDDDEKRPIALLHSGNFDENTYTGSLLQYIVERFNITF